jgi:hypothetical protein
MRVRAALALVTAAAAAPAVAAAPPKPIHGGPISLGGKASATAAAEPAAPGARPVRLVLSLRDSELQCGRLRSRTVIVTTPSALRLPARIARSAVRIGGSTPATIVVSGHTIAMSLAPSIGLTCNVIGPGSVRIVFSPAAGLGNPASAGRYRIGVAAGTSVAVATLPVA